MQIFAKVGDAFQGIKQQIRDETSKRSEAAEKSKNLKELRELALEYHWEEIRTATDDFSENRRLGAGASGTVYRGTLEEGTDVAVKVIEGLVGGGFEEEVRLLSKCRHPNVVMLLGFAREDAAETSVTDAGNGHQAAPRIASSSRRALVYELLSGGDVEDRLIRNKGRPFLWRDRLRTAIDMARGLANLHKHRPEIFHRDIKPPNVLFGADGAARIADFGLACISKRRGVRELAVEVAAGTPGYADPLYAKTGVVTEASEVYSMGMVLMQFLTRRPPALVAQDGSCWFLLNEICPDQLGAKDRLLQMLDAEARWPATVATTLANLAILCIHEDVDQRPSFMDLAAVLQDIVEVDDSKPRAEAQSPSRQGSSQHAATTNTQVIRGASSVQAAPDFARCQSFAQATPMGAQVVQAGQPVVRQVAVMRAPSFAEAALVDGMRPLHDSRVMQGVSFGDGSVVPKVAMHKVISGVPLSGQSGYPYQQGLSQLPPGHAAVGYMPSNFPMGMAALQPVQPLKHGMYVYR